MIEDLSGAYITRSDIIDATASGSNVLQFCSIWLTIAFEEYKKMSNKHS